jgi:hypothetical protein
VEKVCGEVLLQAEVELQKNRLSITDIWSSVTGGL